MNKRKLITVAVFLLLLCAVVFMPHHFLNRTLNTLKFRIYETIGKIRSSNALLEEISPYSNAPYAEYNGNFPCFTEEEIRSLYRENGELLSFESYSALDAFGRTQKAEALLGIDLMPADDREPLSSVRPAGWHVYTVDPLEMPDGSSYLYNRCHLIAFCLSGENDNEKNLITGTRQLNLTMEEFELKVSYYIHSTKNHVFYRVTPVYNGADQLATGVLMEAYSMEDSGKGICFCIFVYNVQTLLNGSVKIDYYDGTAEFSWE